VLKGGDKRTVDTYIIMRVKVLGGRPWRFKYGVTLLWDYLGILERKVNVNTEK